MVVFVLQALSCIPNPCDPTVNLGWMCKTCAEGSVGLLDSGLYSSTDQDVPVQAHWS